MNIVKCEKGHFYDKEKHGNICPHCSASLEGRYSGLHSETAQSPQAEQQQSIEDAKAIVFLEAAISSFVQSDCRDETAFQLIFSAMRKAPLYFLYETDMEALFGGVDVTKLHPGQMIQPVRDGKMKPCLGFAIKPCLGS